MIYFDLLVQSFISFGISQVGQQPEFMAVMNALPYTHRHIQEHTHSHTHPDRHSHKLSMIAQVRHQQPTNQHINMIRLLFPIVLTPYTTFPLPPPSTARSAPNRHS